MEEVEAEGYRVTGGTRVIGSYKVEGSRAAGRNRVVELDKSKAAEHRGPYSRRMTKSGRHIGRRLSSNRAHRGRGVGQCRRIPCYGGHKGHMAVQS